MMSIDHQKDHFKRQREEEEESKTKIINKRRKLEEQNTKDNSNNENNIEFQKKMYQSFIKSAFDALDEKNSLQIDTLANQIQLPSKHSESISVQNFMIVLSILTNNIAKLDNKLCDRLIFSIIKYRKWWTLKPNEISVFKKFITTLCSYLPKWWAEISILLIQQFSMLGLSKTQYHHDLLEYFLRIIPTSIHLIHQQLVSNFPNKLQKKTELSNYVANLLKLNNYCPDLRFQIWSLIVERCIQIDVELQNELDELDDDEFDDSDDDSDEDDEDDDDRKVHFEEDVIDNESEDETDEEDDLMLEEEEVNINEIEQTNISDLSEKLDSILTLVFQNLQNFRASTKNFADEESEEQAVILYNTLTSLFKSHILPTYFTKSTQFILFYFTQQLPELMDSFLVTLIDLSFSPNETIEKRIKSLQYLSSFISRAELLQKSQITYVLSFLMTWLNKFVEEREIEINGNVNMDRFKLFYSTFQVLLYVFCFRFKMLKNENDEWVLNIDKFFQRMLITKFNPLKFCNENVVLMFAKISQEENVTYCFSIIQKNKNERLKGISGTRSSSDLESNNALNITQATQVSHAKQQFIDLEGYFPFDPLFLKNTKSFLKGYYIEWSSIAKDYDSDTDDFDDLADDAKEVVRRNSMNQQEMELDDESSGDESE